MKNLFKGPRITPSGGFKHKTVCFKNDLVLKNFVKILYIIGFKTRGVSNVSPEDKILVIATISQNRLSTFKKIVNFDVNFKKLKVTPGELPSGF